MMKARGGVTLVEVLLAGAIIMVATLALFEGITVANRIARENSDYLAAEAIVWDAVWKRFNEKYDDLQVDEVGVTYDLATEKALGVLYDYTENGTVPAKLCIRVRRNEAVPKLRWIQGELEWGPPGARRRLYGRGDDANPTFVIDGSSWSDADGDSDPCFGRLVQVFRGPLGRASIW